MNPFNEKPMKIQDSFVDWSTLYGNSYDPHEVDPYTKTRIILMNGAEFEAQWFSHQFSRHCNNQDIRRSIAMARRSEKQQQMRIAVIKPIDESILETTISYEQLAVDLTATLAQNEPDANIKKALDFALLEDFDHLYRYADLLEMDMGVKAEELVGRYTEIMPGRPTISEHRCPYDNIRYPMNASNSELISKLNVGIITAAEQQTMNYYMNVAGFYDNSYGRRLYQEIGLIEEQHVSQYESLQDPNGTWLEMLLLHEYTECYLYYSCMMDETNDHLRPLWERHFVEEIAHLHNAAELLKTYEHKEWQQVIPNGEFPQLLSLHSNIDYVRGVLESSVFETSVLENYANVNDIPDDADFFVFQKKLNSDAETVPSHIVIKKYIGENGKDYRYETAPNPIKELQNRKKDNTTVGRIKEKAPQTV